MESDLVVQTGETGARAEAQESFDHSDAVDKDLPYIIYAMICTLQTLEKNN